MPRATSVMPEDSVMAMPTAQNRVVSCSTQNTQTSITTGTIGTQSGLPLCTSTSSQTEEEFPAFSQLGRRVHRVSVKPSMPLVGASRERQASMDSNESELDSLDDASSVDMEDDFSLSDCSTDDENASSHPGTSTGICRVSTSFEQDRLAPAAQRIEFSPRRQPGVYFGRAVRTNPRRFVRAVDFFMLFFTTAVIREICNHTNKYAWMHILKKPAYSERDGSWREVTEEEMRKFIGLLVYMGIIQVPYLHCYWSRQHIFSGLLPQSLMPQTRFKALLAFLCVSDPEKTTIASHGKFHHMSSLLQHMNCSSALFFQPRRNLSVDERMVKCTCWSGIRQFMRDKEVKWGYKLAVLADSETGYTVHFNAYTQRQEASGVCGLAFDVVTRLCENYLDQGYIIFLDCFYTSTSLFVHLLERKTLACGTMRKDQRGYPSGLKDCQWEKNSKRGDVRWLREKGVLYLQWKDRHVVNMMSTAHSANKFVIEKRRKKIGNQWTDISVKKPMLIHKYTKGMLGVNKFDHLIRSNSLLMKSVQWWKTLFFHCIDIAIVNSFILFEVHRQQHPEVPELSRSLHFDQSSFRLELIDQLLGCGEQHLAGPTVPPVVFPKTPPQAPHHQPQKIKKYRNCKLCYEERKVEQKTGVFCETCAANLCFTVSRNCFARWHDRL